MLKIKSIDWNGTRGHTILGLYAYTSKGRWSFLGYDGTEAFGETIDGAAAAAECQRDFEERILSVVEEV